MQEQFCLKNEQDIEDLLKGCAFYGTGGGGEVSAGRTSLLDCLSMGLPMTLLDPDDIKDDALYCCPFFMGSIAPKTAETLAEMESLGYLDRKYYLEEILMGAVRTLEEVSGKAVEGLYIAEPGGSNAGCCMAAAYKMAIPVIDGDPAGRAVPEMTQGLAAIRGMDFLPAAYFDAWGNRNATFQTMHTKAAERIGKFLSEAAYGEMAEAAYLMTGKELKTILVPRTLSKAYQVGRAMRQVEDVLAAAAEAAGGKVVGRGILQNMQTKDQGGYYWGTYEILGDDGRLYKIWFKNENHILWIDGRPAVTSPDLISLIDLEEEEPLLNSHLENGKSVGIAVTPAYDFYHEEKSIESFGPRYFGFDFDYIPFAEAEL